MALVGQAERRVPPPDSRPQACHTRPRIRRRPPDQEAAQQARQESRRRRTRSAHLDAVSAVRPARAGTDRCQGRYRDGMAMTGVLALQWLRLY